MRAILVFLLVLLSAGTGRADDVTTLPGIVQEALPLHVTLPDGTAKTLEALVIRPDGAGPFPLAVITHGMPHGPSDYPQQRPQMYSGIAIGFAQRGYAAVIVMRSGYGQSNTPFVEDTGPCDNRDYIKSGHAAAADILAALVVLRTEPWVDKQRIVLVGHSMGGFTMLAAAAQNPPGVLGAISFAGAIGAPREHFVCQPDRLIAADRLFGETVHIPSLWIFAENDHLFSPDLAHRMFAAYTEHGAHASLVMAAPVQPDGHLLIWNRGETTWWPPVTHFLTTLHLPTEIQITLPPTAPLPPPSPLDPLGRQAFGRYRPSLSFEKAFATDPSGHYGIAFGYRTKTDAEQAALKDCQRQDRHCTVYAVDDTRAPMVP